MHTNSEAAWFRSATFRTQGTHPGIDIGAEDGSNIATVHFDALTETREEVIARADLIVSAQRMLREMQRYLPVLERAESDPQLWIKLTDGLGIATTNGYRHAIEKAQGAAK